MLGRETEKNFKNKNICAALQSREWQIKQNTHYDIVILRHNAVEQTRRITTFHNLGH